MEVASTKTLRPSTSRTLSIMPAPLSNDMEYEKPEHPPPTTPTRRPAGTGFCCAMISLTFATAVGVILTGDCLGVTDGVVGVVVVVAILFSYNGMLRRIIAEFQTGILTHSVPIWMTAKGLRSHKYFIEGCAPGTWNRAIIRAKAPLPDPASVGKKRGNEYRDRSKFVTRGGACRLC